MTIENRTLHNAFLAVVFSLTAISSCFAQIADFDPFGTREEYFKVVRVMASAGSGTGLGIERRVEAARQRPLPRLFNADELPDAVDRDRMTDFIKLRYSVNNNVFSVFRSLVKNDSESEEGTYREYARKEVEPYVGEKGPFTDEQIDSIRKIAETQLLFATYSLDGASYYLRELHALTEDEKDSACRAFNITIEELDEKLADVANSIVTDDFFFNAPLSIKITKPVTKQRGLGELEAMPTLTAEEIQRSLEEIEGDDACVRRCDYIDALAPADRAFAFKTVLQRKPELFSESELAYALQEYAKYYADQAFLCPQDVTFDELEETIVKTLETEPTSWKLSLAGIVALSRLPKTYIVEDDRSPRRATFLELPETILTYKDLNAEIAEPQSNARYLFGAERDRARALKYFDRSAERAAEEFHAGSPATKYFSEQNNSIKTYFLYFEKTLCEELSVKGVKNFTDNAEELQNLTDFQAPLPELSEKNETVRERTPYSIWGLNSPDPLLAEFNLAPTSFLPTPRRYDELKSDRERVVWLFEKRVFPATSSAMEEWQNLIEKGVAAQELYGVGTGLEKYCRNPQPSPGLPNDFSQAKLLSEIPSLKEDESYVWRCTYGKLIDSIFPTVPNDRNYNYEYVRVKIDPQYDFFDYFRRSLELRESYEALACLALEYQHRCHYAQAREYWARARKIAETDKYVGVAEQKRTRRFYAEPINYDAVFQNRRKELDAAASVVTGVEDADTLTTSGRFVFSESYAYGMRSSLCVESAKPTELEFSARRIDLAPELGKAHSREATENIENSETLSRSSFPLQVQQNAFNGKLVFADEDPIRWTSVLEASDESETARARMALPITKPGAYLVEILHNGKPSGGIDTAALVFLTDAILSYSPRTQSENDVETAALIGSDGAPQAERELEIFNVSRTPEMTSTRVVKTDQDGRLSKQELTPFGYSIVVTQSRDAEAASELSDVEVDVFDTRNLHEISDITPELECSDTVGANQELSLAIKFNTESDLALTEMYATIFDPTQAPIYRELTELADVYGAPRAGVLLDAVHAQSVLNAVALKRSKLRAPSDAFFTSPAERNYLAEIASNTVLRSISPDIMYSSASTTSALVHRIPAPINDATLKTLFSPNATIRKERIDWRAKTFAYNLVAPAKPGTYKLSVFALSGRHVVYYAEKDITVEE